MFEGFVLFVVGLFAVALIGHGLWLLGAAIVRSLSDAPSADQREPPPNRRTASETRQCPRCTSPFQLGQIECDDCGWPMRVPRQSERPELAARALVRLSAKFQHLGWLETPTVLELHRAIESAIRPQTPADEVVELSEHDVVAESPAGAAPPAPAASPPAPPQPQPTASEPQPVAPEEYELAPLAARQSPPRSVPPPIPRREPELPAKPLSKILGAFLEEKNIRWGELIGGLLIIGSSIALVLSFWQAIAVRPLLKFGLFNGVTASLFGVGLYVERRWRLPTTTHGVLLIAVLLVPLNFLAIAAFTLDAAPTDPLTIGGEIASLAVFAWLVHAAARVLVGVAAPHFTAAVIGCAAMELLVRRFAAADASTLRLYALGLPAIGCFAGASLWWTRRCDRREPFGEAEVSLLFKILGVALFAALLPSGLLIAKVGPTLPTIARLAPLVGLTGVPLLAAGLTIWRRLDDPTLAMLRVAGTSVAVAGVGAMTAGMAVGWPSPGAMLPAALLNFAAFTWAAMRCRIPAAHLPAALCGAWAYLVALQIAAGRLVWFGNDFASAVRTFASGFSGTALVAPAAVMAAAAWRRPEREASRWYAIAAGITALVSLALVAWFALGRRDDTVFATWVFALYAVGAIAFGIHMRRAALSYVGAVLWCVALVQGACYRYSDWLPTERPLPFVFVVHAATMLAAEFFLRRRGSEIEHRALRPLADSGECASWIAASLLTYAAFRGHTCDAAVGLTALTVMWGLIARSRQSQGWFACCQAASYLAVWQWAHLVVGRQTWFAAASEYPALLDPRAMQAYGLAAAALGGAWFLARRVFRVGGYACNAIAAAAMPSVDRIVSGGLVGLVVALCVYAVVPGVCQELSPRNTPTPAERHVPALAQFEAFGIPHAPAHGVGGWLLAGPVAALVAASLWDGFRRRKLIALAALGVAASMLAAARWEVETATASALRWTSASALVALSIPFWRGEWTARLAARCAWPIAAERLPGLRRTMFWVVLGFTLLPPAAMTVGMSAAAVERYQTPVAIGAALFACGVIAAVGASVASMMIAAQQRRVERGWTSLGAAVLALVSAAPFTATVLFLVAMALKQSPVLGPDPASWFVRIGLATSYAVPVLMIAAALVGHAVAGRSPATAVSAALLLNLAATAGYLLTVAKGGLQFDAALWLRLAHLNAGVSAAFAMAWTLALWKRSTPGDSDETASPSMWFTLQTALAAAIFAPAVALPTIRLAVEPVATGVQALSSAATDAWGWTSLAAAFAAVALYFRGMSRPISIAAWSLAGMTIVAMGAMELAAHWPGTWYGYYALLGGWTLTACLIAIEAEERSRFGLRGFKPPRAVAFWSSFVSVPPVVLVVQGFAVQHDGLYTLPLMLIAGLSAYLAAWVASRWRVFFAAVLINLAATYWWLGGMFFYFYGKGHLKSGREFDVLVVVNLIVASSFAPLWLWLDLRHIRPRLAAAAIAGVSRFSLPPVHRVLAWVAPAVMAIAAVIGLGLDLDNAPAPAQPILTGLAMFAALVATATSLWDADIRWPVPALYLTGLIAAAVALDQFNLPPQRIAWTATLLCSAYALGTSYLWSRRSGLVELCAAIGIRRPDIATADAATAAARSDHRGWLLPVNGVLALGVVVLAYWCILTFEFWRDRLAAAQAVVGVAFAVGLLARGERRSAIQRRALDLGVVGLTAGAWSGLDPGMPGELLNRAVLVVAALCGAVAIYGIGFSKVLRRESEWTAAARSVVPRLIAMAGAALAIVLAVEIAEMILLGRVVVAAAASATVVVGLAGLIVAAMIAAIVPGRDPLGLSERGRTAYVYAAETVLALLFIHVRLTMPHLFAGFYLRYWPVLIMLLAFAGVGLGEVFRRRRLAVLSEPLERTGAFLPLLPVLGFWMLPATAVDYTLLLIGVGLLYGTLAVMRKSFGFGLLALAAFNGGLWHFLNGQDGLGWLEHPQLWLVPPALCVLIAAHLNRRNLGERETTAVRYACAATIYVASTADIFLNGVAEAPHLPAVLGGLSLAGIFAGISLRVRAFLFLGLAFLTLALTTIIWHAGYNLEQTWIFYVTGIVVGALIIAVFAVFEKKRQEILHVVEKLREWDR